MSISVPNRAADDLAEIDAALLVLRRFVSGGDQQARPGPEERVEMSTVLVVDALARRGGPSGIPVSVGDIAVELAVAPSTASRLVDRAEKSGMARRVPLDEDHRRVGLCLTAEGMDLDARSREFRYERLASVMANWADAEVASFATLLSRFASEADAHRRP